MAISYIYTLESTLESTLGSGLGSGLGGGQTPAEHRWELNDVMINSSVVARISCFTNPSMT